MNLMPQSKNLFVDLSDFELWPNDSMIKIKPSKKYITEKKHQENDADTHPLTSKESNKILGSLKIKKSDKVYIYDFSLNKVIVFKVKNLLPLVSFQNPYGGEEYYFGFQINRDKLTTINDYYARNYVIYIGKNNPFNTKDMEKIKWVKIANTHFPSEIFIHEHKLKNGLNNDKDFKEGKDPWGGPLLIMKTYEKSSYQFSKDDLVFHLYFLIRSVENYDVNEGVTTFSHEPSYFMQVKQKSGEVIFKSFHKSSESITVLAFKEETENQWTGKLFKNKAPIYFNSIESYSFGCRSIAVIDKTTDPIRLICNNRH